MPNTVFLNPVIVNIYNQLIRPMFNNQNQPPAAACKANNSQFQSNSAAKVMSSIGSVWALPQSTDGARRNSAFKENSNLVKLSSVAGAAQGQ